MSASAARIVAHDDFHFTVVVEIHRPDYVPGARMETGGIRGHYILGHVHPEQVVGLLRRDRPGAGNEQDEKGKERKRGSSEFHGCSTGQEINGGGVEKMAKNPGFLSCYVGAGSLYSGILYGDAGDRCIPRSGSYS